MLTSQYMERTRLLILYRGDTDSIKNLEKWLDSLKRAKVDYELIKMVGFADNPTGQAHNTEVIVDHVQNQLKQYELSNCVIAGYSYGATVILELMKRGLSFRGAMLINAPYSWKGINSSLRILNRLGLWGLKQPKVNKTFFNNQEKILAKWFSVFSYSNNDLYTGFRLTPEGALTTLQTYQDMMTYDYSPYLKDNQQQIVVINGNKDTTVKAKHSQGWQAFTNIELYLIDSDHDIPQTNAEYLTNLFIEKWT